MKNEFVQDNETNAAINAVYQAMYAKSDRGMKNGETLLTVEALQNTCPQSLANSIQQYFDQQYANPELKKYFIAIEVQARQLQINFKWGHHAIVANTPV